jgi:hypothetical protein
VLPASKNVKNENEDDDEDDWEGATSRQAITQRVPTNEQHRQTQPGFRRSRIP